MVAANRGSVTETPGGLEISIEDHRHFITYSPNCQEEWESRLKWVEKQSAVYLVHAPVLYGVQWQTTAGRPRVRALRLSIGLSLSVGQPFPKRYTCSVISGKKDISVVEGGELPQLAGGKRWLLTALPSWTQKELEKLITGVLRACDLFGNQSEVQDALPKLSEKLSDELSHLDALYRRKQGTNDRLYGLPPFGTEGSAAIEAELRRLQKTVLERYRSKVRLRVLSLGVFEGGVPRYL